MWTFSRRSAFWHAKDPPSTSKSYAATIVAALGIARLKRGIWCSDLSRRSHTNYPLHGGPFIIRKALLNGSYYPVDNRELKDRPNEDHKRKRRDPDDDYSELDRPWNIAQLCPFYT